MMIIGSVLTVQLLRLLHVLYIVQRGESERILMTCQKCIVGFLIVTFRMQLEYCSRLKRHRTVDVYRDLRYGVLLKKHVQIVDDVLGPFHGEGGDDDLPVTRDRIVYHVLESREDIVSLFVEPIAVGCFENEVVCVRHRCRVADNRFVAVGRGHR